MHGIPTFPHITHHCSCLRCWHLRAAFCDLSVWARTPFLKPFLMDGAVSPKHQLIQVRSQLSLCRPKVYTPKMQLPSSTLAKPRLIFTNELDSVRTGVDTSKIDSSTCGGCLDNTHSEFVEKAECNRAMQVHSIVTEVFHMRLSFVQLSPSCVCAHHFEFLLLKTSTGWWRNYTTSSIGTASSITNHAWYNASVCKQFASHVEVLTHLSDALPLGLLQVSQEVFKRLVPPIFLWGQVEQWWCGSPGLRVAAPIC